MFPLSWYTKHMSALMGEVTLNHTILVNYVFIFSRWEQGSNWICICFQYLPYLSPSTFLFLLGCLLNVLNFSSSIYIKDMDGNTTCTTPLTVIWGWFQDGVLMPFVKSGPEVQMMSHGSMLTHRTKHRYRRNCSLSNRWR